MLDGIEKTKYQRKYMRKWRKARKPVATSRSRDYKRRYAVYLRLRKILRTPDKLIRKAAGLSVCALLLAGCAWPGVDNRKRQPPRYPPQPQFQPIRTQAAEPASGGITNLSWDLPVEYPTNCAQVQRWYLQQSLDMKVWINVFVPPVGFFAAGCGTPGQSYTVHWDTNQPLVFWRLKGWAQ